MIEAKPEKLVGDRAYDSDPLDDSLGRDGIEMIAPHRSSRVKPPTQDRRNARAKKLGGSSDKPLSWPSEAWCRSEVLRGILTDIASPLYA
jgi:hypothetical protein